MTTNRRVVDKVQEDFYVTPKWATEALLKVHYIPIDRTILEPCCGDGAISKVLEEHGCSVVSSDIVNRGYGNTISVYDYKVSHGVVITNPPYNDMNRMFPVLYNLADLELCLLLRLAFLEGQERYNKIFGFNAPSKIYVFSERLSMYKNGDRGNRASGTTAYAWFIWNKSVRSNSSQLMWIPPGNKTD